MMKKIKFLTILIVLFMIVLGVNIIITQSIPQGHNGIYSELYIGNWAYSIGSIVLGLGLYIFIITIKDET
jgi:hypothetical protein